MKQGFYYFVIQNDLLVMA